MSESFEGTVPFFDRQEVMNVLNAAAGKLPGERLENMKPREGVEEIVALAIELILRGETLPFPGLDREAYLVMKATDVEYPGYTTPTDEIVGRLESEGMKVVLGKDPVNGNVYILPSGSDNIEMDSISPEKLQINDEMHRTLKRLIEAYKHFVTLQKK